jgi:hypothetical protein
VAGDHPTDPDYDLVSVTISRHRRYWQVMWIGSRDKFRDFRAATLTEAATGVSELVAEYYYSRLLPGSAAEFLILIFGRSLPGTKGPQLQVAGNAGQFTATDVRDNSIVAGATLEDLVVAAGANPAKADDYAMSWLRPLSALLPNP